MSGFLATVGMVEAMLFWTDLYHYAWFLSFGTSFLVYAGLTLRRPGGARCHAVIDNLKGLAQSCWAAARACPKGDEPCSTAS